MSKPNNPDTSCTIKEVTQQSVLSSETKIIANLLFHVIRACLWPMTMQSSLISWDSPRPCPHDPRIQVDEGPSCRFLPRPWNWLQCQRSWMCCAEHLRHTMKNPPVLWLSHSPRCTSELHTGSQWPKLAVFGSCTVVSHHCIPHARSRAQVLRELEGWLKKCLQGR